MQPLKGRKCSIMKRSESNNFELTSDLYAMHQWTKRKEKMQRCRKCNAFWIWSGFVKVHIPTSKNEGIKNSLPMQHLCCPSLWVSTAQERWRPSEALLWNYKRDREHHPSVRPLWIVCWLLARGVVGLGLIVGLKSAVENVCGFFCASQPSSLRTLSQPLPTSFRKASNFFLYISPPTFQSWESFGFWFFTTGGS